MDNDDCQDTTPMEFVGFPKMARLSREVMISEKIDGTNSHAFITPISKFSQDPFLISYWYGPDASTWGIYAGSRTRWITPSQDNHGFAAWVRDHVEELKTLGPGRHFGEWWGGGIQRGYGLAKDDKRFSLFNVSRWCLHGSAPQPVGSANPKEPAKLQGILPPCVGLVPVLWRGMFTTQAVDECLERLWESGSRAAPRYRNPEGVVVWHTAENIGFKKTRVGDESPKSTQIT